MLTRQIMWYSTNLNIFFDLILKPEDEQDFFLQIPHTIVLNMECANFYG